MKLILSRKGFDSLSGGVPSPIFPDGSLCSLPIPAGGDPRLGELWFCGESLAGVASDLTRQRIGPTQGVHLDPDLRRDARPRRPGWLPAFGQCGAAQSHLENQSVGAGDLFLFFGWFRQTSRNRGRFTYDERAPHLHVMFGWLQVGRVLKPSRIGARIPAWAAEHPHVAGARQYSSNNTLYLASQRLGLAGVKRALPGAGVFPRFYPRLRLTAPGLSRGYWHLPSWFMTDEGRPPLSYHSDRSRWNRERSGVLLKTVGRGQEFVLDCACYPEAAAWLVEIFAGAT